MPDPAVPEVQPTVMSAAAKRRLQVVRNTAFTLAWLFLLATGIHAVWVTRTQMVDQAQRGIAMTRAVVDGSMDARLIDRLFAAAAVEGVTYRTVRSASGGVAVIGSVDHGAIWRAALRANIGTMLFILALAIPTLVSFGYLRRMVNRPAFALLDYAQSDLAERRLPPEVPPIWQPVLERLKQLKSTQAQMQAFLHYAPMGMSAHDPNGRYVIANRRAAAIYDHGVEDLIGKELPYFAHHFPDWAKLTPLVREPLDHSATVEMETPFVAPSGEMRLLRVTTFPIFGADGKVDLVGTYFTDVTDQRRVETDLEQSRALFEAFIQNAPNPMALMDAQGRYVMLNNATASYYDMTPDALLAAGPKFIHSRFLEATTVIAPMLGRVMASLEAEQVDTLFEAPSGGIRDMAFAFFPILDRNGELAFVGNISHDMTDERRTQAELAKSKDSLHQAEKLAALGSMLAGVSHELNNPLAAVIGQAALLGEDLEDTPHADRIAKIRRAADRCARIVQSFLAMARQKAPEYRSVNVNDQVRAAAELTEYQMRAANVTLDLRLLPGLPKIAADPDQLHQVIVNLLTNARQALEAQSDDRRVTVTTAFADKTVTLSVADNGVGIDPAMRQRIFDPFFTTKEVGSGTGIGLAYSLGIVEAHGGTITIEDAAEGTVFVVRLPVTDAGAASAIPEKASTPASRGRALIVDDEADVAETLADMLVRIGLDATVAIGGKAGQAALADGAHFDLVLSDIRMPDLDGPALYAWIAANRPDLAGSVAFVTGDTMSRHAADFLATARCLVLEKPFTPVGLRALVARMPGQSDGETA